MPFRQLILIVTLLFSTAAWAEKPMRIEVFKSASCGCCGAWIKHLRQHGLEVVSQDVTDVPALRQKLGMPERFGSCHSARIGGYVIEGHVPAEDILRLLKQKAQVLGLAVPSMPPGSPGMESENPVAYDTLVIKRDGTASVFATHTPK